MAVDVIQKRWEISTTTYIAMSCFNKIQFILFHALKIFFVFSPFCARLALRWAKNANMTAKQIWRWFRIHWKMFFKSFCKKNFICMKVHKLCTFSTFGTICKSSQPSNFLYVNTFATFLTDSNSASNSAFLKPTSKLWVKNICWFILTLFANF